MNTTAQLHCKTLHRMQIYHHIIMKLKRSKNKGCSININNKSVGFDEPALGYLRILC